ncbi:STAS domain-containing protein [Tessaracoccus sp. MC1865]|uniref:STAS domain-containing protein n=1 Tax=Tessaracoccus sp. MC1865 TaxID=2760310 RepID=UPI0015FED046|nr:STAS domain-containing protein [Tessaracoccus sp. MC1865]MBB1484470.1 STAS domain-containing protein [Tessaracoccus sp. MC1865]QTO38427.1 STAS domain-containing protein [Tessaracoccus sp. MC1865]
MNLTTNVAERYVIVSIEGRFTAAVAPLLRHRVDDLISEGHTRVVVDLGATAFIDSSGLGALIGALKAARVAGGDLRIAAAPEQVVSVLRLTNLDRVLRNHATPDSAFDA